jgi:hypothetical protein
MKTVLPFSGGLDSTYCAWSILSSTDDDLTLVFLDLSNSPDGVLDTYGYANVTKKDVNAFSKYSVQKIHAWLSKNVRPCSLVFIDLDQMMLSENKRNGSSAIQCLFPLLVEKVNSGEFDRIISSHERENDGGANGGSRVGEDGKLKRGIGAKRTLEYFESNAVRGSYDFILLEKKYTQANAIKELPAELYNFTVSCDNVKNGIGCGECFKCNKRKFFCDQIESGMSVDAIYDKYIAQCSVDGRWWSMKNWIGVYMPTINSQIVKKTWNMPDWPSSYKVQE